MDDTEFESMTVEEYEAGRRFRPTKAQMQRSGQWPPKAEHKKRQQEREQDDADRRHYLKFLTK